MHWKHTSAPAELVRFQESGLGLGGLLRAHSGTLLCIAGSISWAVLTHSVWALLAALVLVAVLTFLVLPLRVHSELVRAGTWGRWRRVRFLARILRVLTAPLGNQIVHSECTFRLAQAAAGLGDLERALALVKPWEQRLGPSMYYGRLESLYEAARRYDDVIACAERAMELSGGGTEHVVELALQLVQYRFDSSRVRDLLARTHGKAMPEIFVAAAATCRAALLLEDSQAATALEELSSARPIFEKYGAATESAVAIVDYFRARALRQIGDSSWRAVAAGAYPCLDARGYPFEAHLEVLVAGSAPAPASSIAAN